MVTPNTKNQIRALYNKLKEVDIDNLSVKKCNGYIQHLEYIKELLYKIGENWVEDMEEVYEVATDIFGKVNKEDLEEVVEEVLDQIDLMMTRLGIEEDEKAKEHVSSSPNMNIQISPKFSQNQTTNVSIETQASNLYQEFEKELSKPNPDKLRLRDIVKDIIKLLGIIF